MSKNMGVVDRGIRTVLAIIFITMYQLGLVSGLIGVILVTLGIVFLFTAVISYCPLYSLFGFNTCRADKN